MVIQMLRQRIIPILVWASLFFSVGELPVQELSKKTYTEPERIQSIQEVSEEPQLPAELSWEIWETGIIWNKSDIARILQEDLTEPSKYTRSQLIQICQGEMKPYVDMFVNSASQIKPEALIAIAAMETGHFTSPVWKSKNNPGGIQNWQGEYQVYNSPTEGIQALRTLLKSQYLNEDGRYYTGGTTILDISQHYNSNQEWLKLYVDVRLSQERRLEKV